MIIYIWCDLRGKSSLSYLWALQDGWVDGGDGEDGIDGDCGGNGDGVADAGSDGDSGGGGEDGGDGAVDGVGQTNKPYSNKHRSVHTECNP